MASNTVELVDDAKFKVFEKMDITEIVKLRLVNREWRDAVDSYIGYKHRTLYGPTDKKIDLKIKDLTLQRVVDRISTTKLADLDRVNEYGFLYLLEEDIEADGNPLTIYVGSRSGATQGEYNEELDEYEGPAMKADVRDLLIRTFPEHETVISAYAIGTTEARNAVPIEHKKAFAEDYAKYTGLDKIAANASNTLIKPLKTQTKTLTDYLVRLDSIEYFGTDYSPDDFVVRARKFTRDNIDSDAKLDSGSRKILKEYTDYIYDKFFETTDFFDLSRKVLHLANTEYKRKTYVWKDLRAKLPWLAQNMPDMPPNETVHALVWSGPSGMVQVTAPTNYHSIGIWVGNDGQTSVLWGPDKHSFLSYKFLGNVPL